MLRKWTLMSVAAAGLVAMSAMPAMAQSFGIRINTGSGGGIAIGAGRPVYPPPAYPVTVARPVYQQNCYDVQWRSEIEDERSFEFRDDAYRFADRKRDQGYDVRVTRHGHHYHVRFRTVLWETYRTCYSHREAHDVCDYLRARGYETRVVHR